jgi:hypothetical protein
MNIGRRGSIVAAFVTGTALGAVVSGTVMAQSVVSGPMQHFTIHQDGKPLGTIEVSAGVQVSIGTVFSHIGVPVDDVLLRIAVGSGQPVVLHIPRASVSFQGRAATN